MPATFDQLLAEPYARKIFLLEADYFDTVTRTEGTLYAGSETYLTGPGDTPASVVYRDGLDIIPWMERSLFGNSEGGQRIGGPAEVARGEITLNNVDGSLDHLTRYAFDGRAFRMYVGGETSPGVPWDRADFQLILSGTTVSREVGMESVTLQIGDPRAALDVPLQSDFYKGLGACLQYDGVNDRLNIASTFAPANNLCVEFRLRVLNGNTAGTAQVVAYHASGWTSATRDWYFEVSTAGVLSAILDRRAGGAPLTLTHTGVDVRDSAWRHVALVIETNVSATLYIDGVSVATGTPPNLTSAVCELGIGTIHGAASNFANVEVDEFRYWNAVRSATEVSDNRDRTVDPTSTSLLHYWRMDEATGATAFDSVTSGAIDLTVTGATWVSTLEGREDLAGKVKPRTVGPANNVEGVLVDPQLSIWQFHNGRVRKFRAVYWRGVQKTEGADYTADLERGCITALVAVDGVVTADLDAEADGGYFSLPGNIMRRLFTGYAPLTGDCLSFDGVNDEVSTGVTSPAGAMSMEAMVYVPEVASTVRVIHGWGNGTNAGSRRLNFSAAGANTLRFRVVNDAGTQYSADWVSILPPNTWHRVSGVLDTAGGFAYLYVDGVQRGSAAIAGAFTTTLNDHKIGRRADAATEYLNARIDDVRIWSTARSATEIKDYMWQELSGADSGLAHNWQFNEGTGTSALDKVSGGTNGTVSGATWLSSEDGSVVMAAAPHDWDTLLLTNTNSVAHHWGDSISRLDAISEVAAGPGFFHAYENSGTLRVGRVDVPKASKLGASALYFDGLSGVFSAGGSGSRATTDGEFTVELWVRPDSISGAREVISLFHVAAVGPPAAFFQLDGWRLWLDEGVPTFTCIDSSLVTQAEIAATDALPRGCWSHLAVTSEETTAGKLRLFVNSVLAASGTLPAGTFTGTSAAYLVGQSFSASGKANNFFHGAADEVRVWSNPRKQVNIARDMLQEISATQTEASDIASVSTSPTVYFKLNDGSGTAPVDAVGGAAGTLTGSGVTWCRAVDATIAMADVLSVPTALPHSLPQALVRVGWSPNFRPMTDDELASSVSTTRRAFLTEPLRWATYDSPAVREAHPLSPELAGLPAHFSTETAAKAEALRLSGIYGNEREPLQAIVARQFGRLDPGDLIRLVYPRRGMDQGCDFVALGVRDDPSAEEVLSSILALWS